WGYLEDWYAHALRINVDKTDVHKNEEIKVSVFNETMIPVENATIHVDSQTYTTNEDGYAIIKLANKGDYTIYAEKDGYVRSEKITVHVKTLTIDLPEKIIQLFQYLHLYIFFDYNIENLKIIE
ncbi:MAG TPA: carboxypeptidase regulatory-like domain-containing protein, partial [Thermoplasmatales archaeon]|nr:carboxypeptidase regulatory-like domain-containing protein [Thermoplasmatales archaeon]